jgi:putative aldouronate transport system permease protein
MIIMFILSISRMMFIGLDAPILLQNNKVIDVSEVLSTYVYKMGLQRVQYSFATAVGLFQSVINIILLTLADRFAKAINQEGIF